MLDAILDVHFESDGQPLGRTRIDFDLSLSRGMADDLAQIPFLIRGYAARGLVAYKTITSTT